jgi:adenosylhomocysteine nucleosidase
VDGFVEAGTIAIIAALPREIAGLVRGVKPKEALVRQGIYLYRLPGAIVVAGGMGAARVALAVNAALAVTDVSMLISTGLAGACSASVNAGSVLEANVVVETRTGERFDTMAAGSGMVLATTEAIASVREKARLHATYGAQLVDMEAATVARLARARGLSFRAIKGVSDAHDFELDALGKFGGRHGGFRTGAFALHTALRPGRWGKAMELGRGSSAALAVLEQALRLVVGC